MTNCYICGKTRNIINNSGNITFHKYDDYFIVI